MFLCFYTFIFTFFFWEWHHTYTCSNSLFDIDIIHTPVQIRFFDNDIIHSHVQIRFFETDIIHILLSLRLTPNSERTPAFLHTGELHPVGVPRPEHALHVHACLLGPARSVRMRSPTRIGTQVIILTTKVENCFEQFSKTCLKKPSCTLWILCQNKQLQSLHNVKLLWISLVLL